MDGREVGQRAAGGVRRAGYRGGARPSRRRDAPRPGRVVVHALSLVLALAVAACAGNGAPADPRTADELAALPWEEVVEAARGTEVLWRMWRGDPSINAYVEEWVAPRLLERHGIRLQAVQGQGAELVNQLTVEREAGARGFADLMWINGETFHQLRSEALLQGPWAQVLPSAAFVDSTSAVILTDFERPVDGWESPWGQVQFAMIYDSARTPVPPRTVEELGAWIRANPGRFTHDQSFAGVTFLKGLLYALNGGAERFQGGFDEALYREGSARVWMWLEEHTPHFWRGGAAYPAEVAELHRLFANREVDMSFSNNQNEVVTKVRQGIFPETARATVLRDASIANAHYLGIPFNARNPAGAMVVADFLLSPEAQLQKAHPDVWGDGTVLAPDRLPAEWRERFGTLESDPRAIPGDTLARYAQPEVAAEYHERILEDWRTRIRGAR